MILAVATIVEIVLGVCLLCAVLLATDAARHQVERTIRAAAWWLDRAHGARRHVAVHALDRSPPGRRRR